MTKAELKVLSKRTIDMYMEMLLCYFPEDIAHQVLLDDLSITEQKYQKIMKELNS